ncbi:hypothetical protein OG618_37160 (plasmid) [Kitasatospora sp. NBC_01246]|uniref:hypothetical protein n=1 Tax=Kitasatospora sp. NBC_01246 TaxID=2903570 RepID=UPI002E33DBC4|nr:hypothetical protein [Kitasatospora sp. NBC_01246]
MIARLPVTRALAALLAAATGRPCGVGALPRTDAGAPEALPYCVLHPLPWDVQGAPFSDRSEDASALYQAVCVAETTEQAEWLADRVRAAVLERDRVTGRWLHQLDLQPGVTCRGRSIDIDAGTEQAPGDGIVDYMIRFRLDLTSPA